VKRAVRSAVESRYFVPACYALFFILAFLISLCLSFPAESFKQRIIYEIEKRTPFMADIKSVGISPIFGFKVYDLRLYKAKQLYLNIDDLKVSPSLFYLFFNELGLPFKAHLYGGEAKGSLVYSLKTNQVTKAKGKVNSVNIEGIPAIPIAIGDGNSSVQGILQGDFSVELGSAPKGQIVLGIKDLWTRNVRLLGEFSLPDFGKLESNFKSHIENGATKVEELSFRGRDIDLMLFGTMPLLWEISRQGNINLNLRLRTERAAKGKLGFLSALLAPQSDGSLGGKIVGTFGSPRLVKETVGAR
jgi:type II secretion system protein N